ncbi:MAG: threonine/serine exporter family protein [Oscillospiraceae bacterium]|nr:threonine/serine exporter family protein [Oscillospiraceae bacterium]
MTDMIIQLLAAFFGTLGFALIFQVRRKLLFWTALGGMLSWAVYLVLDYILHTIFLPYMCAAVAAAVYAQIMARIQKVPATIYLILALIPSIPGGALYYTMSNLVMKNWPQAVSDGKRTLQYALAIAIGISIVWAVTQIVERVRKSLHRKPIG